MDQRLERPKTEGLLVLPEEPGGRLLKPVARRLGALDRFLESRD